MNSIKKIVFPAVFFVSLVLILCLKCIPSGQLWKNYNILYVPAASDDKTVVSQLESCGIEDAVVLSKQYLPVLFSENSPEIAMYRLNSSSEDFSYIQNRNNYFFDKSNQYRLYYIPVKYKSELSAVLNGLNSKNISAGIDSTSAYPWFLPLICLVLAIVLMLFSVNKLFFAFTAVLPVIFVFCNPFYPAALSNILIQLSLFFVSNLWNRKGILNVLVSSIFVPVMLLISVFSCFSAALQTGFVFIVCLLGTVSAVFIYLQVQKFIDSRLFFVPVSIRPAWRVSAFAKKQNAVMLWVTGAAFAIILLFMLTSSDSVNSHFAKIQLPSANGVASDLPDLDDYSRFVWKIKTYPYKSLNVSDSSNFSDSPETVEFRRYSQKDGIIQESVQKMVFDQEFIEQSKSEVDLLPFDSIEKVLKSQNKDLHPGFASVSSYHTGIFGIIMNLLCLFVLLFIYISIIIKKGARK